ncbi:MAG: hypothetical protein QM479_06225 [Pseudomonadota bacterium]
MKFLYPLYLQQKKKWPIGMHSCGDYSAKQPALSLKYYSKHSSIFTTDFYN